MEDVLRGSKAIERVQKWGVELFQELLPEQERPRTTVLLACDDETIRVVAERLGLEGDNPSAQFGRDVQMAFRVGKISGWKEVVAGPWGNWKAPRPLPDFFPVLCLWVLAATRMEPDDRFPTSEYHGRLCELIGVGGGDSLPCFNFIGQRFRDFARWLEEDMEGRHGSLIVPSSPHPEHVGYAVSQTVFRLRDRQVLSRFFTERLGGSLEGFDPLRRLRRWAGRNQLTTHARRLVDNEEFADRVRAAIRAAYQSWDGSELVETKTGQVGRFWVAKIRLIVFPVPALQFGSGHTKSIELELEGEQQLLAPGMELILPWGCLNRMVDHAVDLGDPRVGGIRLPRVGETLLFENGEEGLLRVEQPSAESVWVLSRDQMLTERLARQRFSDGGVFPKDWELFYDVLVSELPGVTRAPVEDPQHTPLQIQGGLPVGRRRYLSGYPPVLAAGELETQEAMPVYVNGAQIGTICSHELVSLPAEVGWVEVEVGAGDFVTDYEVIDKGSPSESRLYHSLEGERALRSGARPPIAGNGGATVSGAALSSPYVGQVPFLTRVLCDVETISSQGELHLHRRPSTLAWFREVGLPEFGRWELFCDDCLVWLLMPPAGGKFRVRLLTDIALNQLQLEAAHRVVELGNEVDVVRGAADATRSRVLWKELVALASALVDGGVSS